MPADFGLVALAMTLVVLLDALSELPIGQAIVTMSNPSEGHYDTAFTIAVKRAVVLGSAYVLLGCPFARFYKNQRAIGLIIVLSVAFMSRGLVSPKLAQFARALDFRRNSIIDFTGKLASLIVAGYSALTYHSYWAIAADDRDFILFFRSILPSTIARARRHLWTLSRLDDRRFNGQCGELAE